MHPITQNLDLSARGIWFPISVGLLLFFFSLFMPKRRINWVEFYITFGVVGYVAWMSDTVVGRMLDLVDLGDPKITGLGEFASYTFTPSSLSVIYLNYAKKTNKWILVFLFTLLSTLIEWVMIQVGYLKMKNWSFFIFSIIAYLIVFSLILPVHVKVIRNNLLYNK
ncbi:hypothetical protein BEH_24605 (plasmid) [Priestia filamentosa]|uniref:Uncharacterized protein n=1 Tax=Priestia filamentosa TaxID=1402861 RepID=A0A2L1FFN1_9BACI|nr:hypothetical protein [Priestia filamentosa]AVD54546.1 hypothetical protein CKF96_03290 [Priestia filamentosa]AWG44883.1 hypothetical protein BEH_24605 [Priestia filamentosa]